MLCELHYDNICIVTNHMKHEIKSSPLLPYSYTQNGLLGMLDRNRRIKPKPERFQECSEHFDVIITCEERVYDQVIEGN